MTTTGAPTHVSSVQNESIGPRPASNVGRDYSVARDRGFAGKLRCHNADSCGGRYRRGNLAGQTVARQGASLEGQLSRHHPGSADYFHRIYRRGLFFRRPSR